MKKLNPSDLSSLLGIQNHPCVSIYIDGGRNGLWSAQTMVRYRNMLRKAEAQLKGAYSPKVVEKVIGSLRFYTSLEQAAPHAKGLCFFSSPYIKGFMPLSSGVENRVVVSQSFHIKPILDFLSPREGWYLLTVNHSQAALYQGRGRSLELVKLHDFPPVSFGFERNVALDLCALLKERAVGNKPIFVRGNERIGSTLQSLCPELEISTLLSHGAVGTPFSLDVLLNQVWDEVSVSLSRRRKASLQKVLHAYQHGKALVDPLHIVKGLMEGRTTLMAIRKEDMHWGQIDWSAGSIQASRRPENFQDDCVYDDIAERAILLGCEVIACTDNELPGDIKAVAIVV